MAVSVAAEGDEGCQNSYEPKAAVAAGGSGFPCLTQPTIFAALHFLQPEFDS